MGKASRKKRYSEEHQIKQSPIEKDISSIIAGKYAFLAAFLLITVVTFLVYSNTFSSSFHFDDTTSIVENRSIRNLNNFYPPSGTRYIGYLSFALNYYAGGLEVFGYHFVNIIIHIINALLVWWLVVLTFRTPFIKQAPIDGSQLAKYIAITSSLLFAIHPIQTQAVTYIVQRFASLATLFYILSLALYIKSRLLSPSPLEGEGRGEGSLRGRRPKQFFFYLLSLFSAILAMKTKEISFTLPFLVILYEFMFFTPRPSIPHKEGGIGGVGIASPSPSSLRGQSHKQSQPLRRGFSVPKRFLYLLPYLLTMLIIPLSIIGTDKPLGDIVGELRGATYEVEDISRKVYLLTQFRVITTYIRLLFLPINQNLDYDYPLSHSLFEIGTFLSFLLLIMIFILAIYLFIRSRSTRNTYSLLASFGIFWFFITLSVESSIIPIRDVIYEHRVYLPSVGFIVAISAAAFYSINYARERLGIKISLLPATIILLLVTGFPLSIAAYKRNFIWKNEVVLWKDVISKGPGNARGYNNLGDAYYKTGLLNEAIGEFTKALQIAPEYVDAIYNLGAVHHDKGNIIKAVEQYEKAHKIAPEHIDALYNLAIVYQNQGNVLKAIEYYEKAHKIAPDLADILDNLAFAYATTGRMQEAEITYQKLLKLEPNWPDIHYNLGLLNQQHGRIEEAIKEYRKSLEIKPDFAATHNNLGSIYLSKGLIDEAIKEFKEVVRLQNSSAEAHYNLGLAYKNKGLRDEAIKEFMETLNIQPDHEKARIALKSF